MAHAPSTLRGPDTGTVAGFRSRLRALAPRHRSASGAAAAVAAEPGTDAAGAHGRDLEAVYVWDLVVRWSHWLIAGAIVVLAITGIQIGRPSLTAPGPAGQQFITGWARILHFYAAIVFTLSVAARLAWMVVGPRRSGWRNFVPVSRRRRIDLVNTLRFYTMRAPTPPTTIGHNPIAGLSYIGVFALYLLMVATGFALYSVGSHSYMRMWSFLIPVFHGVQGARWLHHVTTWILIAFAIAHLFLTSLTSRSEKNGVVDSMVSGYKFLPKGQPPDDEMVDEASGK